MSFFDDGDEPRTAVRPPRPHGSPRRPQRRAGVDDRTLLVRRGAAALVALVIVVLIVLGVKAILDSQATAALKKYASDVSNLVTSEEADVRLPLFQQLDGAYQSSNQSNIANSIEATVQQEGFYYHSAQRWSVPSQMVPAQRWFVGVLGLRYTALEKIERQITGVLGNGNQASAITGIAGDMEILSAADVDYAERVRPLILEALAGAGISGQPVAPSALLPDVGWLDPRTAAQRILGFVPVSLGGAPASGPAGDALTSVSVDGAALSSAGTNTYVLGPSGVTFDLAVANSGTQTEHDVTTFVHFAAAVDPHASCLNTQSTIPKTVPGGTYRSSISVSPPDSCSGFFGVPLDMTAEVEPVPGETNTKNNSQRFLVEFSSH